MNRFLCRLSRSINTEAIAEELRPRRSVLYVPGANVKALNKLSKLKTDCVIMDLEDAVGPSQKEIARENIKTLLKTTQFPKKEMIIRANCLNTKWGKGDIEMIAKSGVDGVALPKVETKENIYELEELMQKYKAPESMKIWCLIETPLGVLNAKEICGCSERITALVMGTSDLVKDMHIKEAPNRENLLFSLSQCLTAARAYNKSALDGVYLNYKDLTGFEKHCEHGKMLGFDGKTLIHPSTIDITNKIYSPSEEEVEYSKKVIDAYEKANTELVTLNGQLIERLHYKNALRIMSIWKRIQELN